MSDNDPAIVIQGLRKTYGPRRVLEGLDLQVKAGEVYAFLGTNGAGKTTAIRTLLGIIPAESGTVRVLGRDPWQEGTILHQEVGFVSEDRSLHDWMTVEETMRFHGAFYPKWDAALAGELCQRLKLGLRDRVASLSRGGRGRLSLVCALGHRPRLLVLDEPTAGLDVGVRRDFIEQMIELISEEGRAVFFSSHQLEDVQRVADRFGILAGGRLVLEAGMEELRESYRWVRARFGGTIDPVTSSTWGIARRSVGDRMEFLVPSDASKMEELLRDRGASGVESAPASLEDVFLALTEGREGNIGEGGR